MSDTIVPWGHDYFLLKQNKQWNRCNKKTLQIENCPFDDFILFDGKNIIGKINNQWNLLNNNLEILNKTPYDTIYNPIESAFKLAVTKGGKMGIISYGGVELVPPSYKNITFENYQIKCEKGIIFIANDLSVSVYDSMERSSVYNRGQHLMLVKKNGQYGFIDAYNIYFENE